MKEFFTKLVVLLAILTGGLVQSQTDWDWQVTAPDSLWNGATGDRWSDGMTTISTRPTANNVLRFNNNHLLETRNNPGGTYELHGIEFAAGSTLPRRILGNPLRLRNVSSITPFIQNLSTATMQIDNALNGDVVGQVVEIRALNGDLDFRGGFNTQGSTVHLISNPGRDIFFNNTISGSGSITVLGGGVVRFNGGNNYSGFTRIEDGELWGIRNTNVITNTNPNYIGNAAEQDLRAAYYTAIAAGATISSNFTVEAGNSGMRVLGSRNTSGTAVFSGIITNDSETELHLDSKNSGILLSITGDITGVGHIVIAGNGIHQFATNAKTYTGFTRFDSGVFRVLANDLIPDASNLIFNGGTFRTGNTTGFSDTVGTMRLTENSIIELGTGSHSLTFANSSAVSWTAGKELLIRNWVGTVGASGAGTAGRIFVGVGGLTADQLEQINFNGYTGALITASGELVPASRSLFYSQGSLPPNELTSWNTAIDGSGVAPVNFNLGGNFQIQSGHTMVTTATWNINVGSSQLEILDGGVLQANHTITLPTAGTFTVRNGGTYIHNNTTTFASSIYQGAVVFEPSSTVEYRNTATTAPTVSTYGHLRISTTASGNFNFNGALALVQGDLTFANGGSRTIIFQGNSGSDASCSVEGDLIVEGGTISLLDNAYGFTLSVGGDFNQSGGSFTLHRNSQNVIAYLQIEGNFEATGGTFNLTTNSNAGTGSGLVIVSGGNFTQTGTAVFGGNRKELSGFYFNSSPVLNLSVRSTPVGVRDRFYYDSSEVLTVNEAYTGPNPLNGITGLADAALPGYDAWPSVISSLSVNSTSTVTFNLLDKEITNALTLLEGTLLVSQNRTLTYSGPSTGFTRTAGQLNVSATNATLNLNQTGILTLPTSLFAANTRNLTLSGAGVKASEDITLTGILNLAAANPNATDGLLDMVINYGDYATVNNQDQTSEFNDLNSHTLFMTSTATTIGQGDVTGKITRDFVHANNVAYTYGNENMQLRFSNGTAANRPSRITVIATRGDRGLHVDKDGINDFAPNSADTLIGGPAVRRLYQVLRTGGQAVTRFTVRFPYSTSELNGNTPANLVTWDHHIPYETGVSPHEHGKTSESVGDGWVELSNHGLFYLSEEGDTEFTKYWMLSDKVTEDILWMGAAGGPAATDWNTPSNWTSGVVPTATTNIVIPSANVYKSELTITATTTDVGTIQIKPGAVLNHTGTTLRINSGPSISMGNSSWSNSGTFNPGTGTVSFNFTTDDATISGSTQFNNLTVASGTNLVVQSGANISIGTTLIQTGTLDATTFPNTFTYNGTANQSAVVPSGGLGGYHNLVVDKVSGTLTAPATTDVYGTLSLLNGSYVISSRLLRLFGPYPTITSGSFTTNTTTDIEFNNSGVGSVTLPAFGANIRNLTFNSGLTFELPANTTLTNGNLTITQGTVDLGSFTINRSANGGTLTLGNGGALRIGGTNGFPTNYATHAIDALSSVTFNGGNQTIGNLNSSQSYGSLTVSGFGTKNMSGLTAGIRGNFTVQNAVAVTLPSTIRFNGDITQAISGLSYQNIEFSGIGNKSFTSNGSVASNGVVTFGAGGAAIDFDGPSNNVEFTFLSDATSTAQIANATGYSFTGNAVSQRYHRDRRAFRFVTSPVTTTSTIRDNWMEGTNNTLTGNANNQNPNPGFGTHITGQGGAANGFDQTATNNPSMFGWDNNTQSWTTVDNTNVNTLVAGVPYRMLLRGDRTTGLLANGATPTITRLRARGIPHVGNRTYNTTAGSGSFIFVGNPYMAQVDMEAVLDAASNVNRTFMYVWDSRLGTNGAYTTVNVVDNSATGGSPARRLLQPGQAVFVETTGAGGSLTISETHKVTSATNEAVFRSAANQMMNDEGSISLVLYEANAFAVGATARDGVVIRFGDFDNAVDFDDAIKFGNPDEEFASFAGDTRLSFNSRMYPEAADIIQLHNIKYRHSNYVMTAEVSGMQGQQVFLHDQFNNTFQQLPNSSNTLYAFSVEASNEATTNPNRFRIVVEPEALSNPNTPDVESLAIRLYPNPTSGNFMVYHPANSEAKISVYTLLGQLVQSTTANAGDRTEINLGDGVSEGIYLVQLQSGNKVVTEKIAVKR